MTAHGRQSTYVTYLILLFYLFIYKKKHSHKENTNTSSHSNNQKSFLESKQARKKNVWKFEIHIFEPDHLVFIIDLLNTNCEKSSDLELRFFFLFLLQT